MEAEKLGQIMAKLPELGRPTMSMFVRLEEECGSMAEENGGFSMKHGLHLYTMLIQKLGFDVTVEEVGDLPPDHDLYTQMSAKVAEAGVPTGPTGGSTT